jgi:hypothetical protein
MLAVTTGSLFDGCGRLPAIPVLGAGAGVFAVSAAFFIMSGTDWAFSPFGPIKQ